jgi:FRG domain
MSTLRVNNWNELQETLLVDSWNAGLGRFRSPYAFRGLPDEGYRLETSLIRLGGNYAELEHHLLRNFRKYAHRDVVERDSLWHWLSVAQHHGLPTRLLDWTYSPFVAMHFATGILPRSDTDAVIWAVNYVEAKKLLPDTLRVPLSQEGSDVFTIEMLSSFEQQEEDSIGSLRLARVREVIIKSLEDFDSLSPNAFLLFFEPPSIDDRIVNQFALFSVVSNSRMPVDQWLAKHPNIYHKIIIPAELKWEIRDKLDQANITERVLFPGLDGLTSWLRRHYSPKR